MVDLGSSPEMKRLERNLTVEMLWVYILSILREQDMHAYVLREEIRKRFGFLPGNVSAYVVLYKLESRDFVKGKQVENRKVYSITERGRALLKEAETNLSRKQKLVFDQGAKA